MSSGLEEISFLTRLCCIFISCTLNMILLFTVIYKIFWKREKIFNLCLLLLISYLLFAFITPFYNILYRFMITSDECFLSDTIEECLIIFTRIIILFFYLARLKTVFQDTMYEVNNKLLIFLGLFIISYSIIIPLLWIPNQIITPHVTEDLGVYCSNTGFFPFV